MFLHAGGAVCSPVFRTSAALFSISAAMWNSFSWMPAFLHFPKGVFLVTSWWTIITNALWMIWSVTCATGCSFQSEWIKHGSQPYRGMSWGGGVDVAWVWSRYDHTHSWYYTGKHRVWLDLCSSGLSRFLSIDNEKNDTCFAGLVMFQSKGFPLQYLEWDFSNFRKTLITEVITVLMDELAEQSMKKTMIFYCPNEAAPQDVVDKTLFQVWFCSAW